MDNLTLHTFHDREEKQNTVSEETYTNEYIARKDAELELYKLKRQLENSVPRDRINGLLFLFETIALSNGTCKASYVVEAIHKFCD